MTNPYDQLDQVEANFVPISPLSFLRRAARVYPNHPAVVHGERTYSYAETFARSRRLASALDRAGIGKGDTVAAMCTNTPEIFEAHYGVPATGAVLNAINTRLEADTIAYILDHGEAKVLITDREYSAVIKEALGKAKVKPRVIDVNDVLAPEGDMLGDEDYESFIGGGDEGYPWKLPDNEWDAISLNYTSGTTGNPKGVVCHHRGAYMNAIGNAMAWNMTQNPNYLWTLPMFHCNGWCFPWTLAAYGGTSFCLRNVEAKAIYASIADQGVDHLCGAPIVLGMIVNASDDEKREFDHLVKVLTAGAAPPAAILEKMEAGGFEVTHTYGLTEVYGPAAVCAWHDEWNELSAGEQANLRARQGVPYAVLEELTVIDPESMELVPADGETMGEVMFQGNNVMKGYLKNEEATSEAFHGGYFHSGDLGVMHPDGYVELRDRSKDIIISGGENISSIEVENMLYKHPAVLAVAVVAKPDEKWGETPCAFVELKPDADEVSAREIIDFARDNLAHFKCPRYVVFGELPKTSTGKIQKFVLRGRVDEAAAP